RSAAAVKSSWGSTGSSTRCRRGATRMGPTTRSRTGRGREICTAAEAWSRSPAATIRRRAPAASISPSPANDRLGIPGHRVNGPQTVGSNTKRAPAMRFICLGYADEHMWDKLSKSELDAFMEECMAYDDVLRKGGHFVRFEGLQNSPTAKTLRHRG